LVITPRTCRFVFRQVEFGMVNLVGEGGLDRAAPVVQAGRAERSPPWCKRAGPSAAPGGASGPGRAQPPPPRVLNGSVRVRARRGSHPHETVQARARPIGCTVRLSGRTARAVGLTSRSGSAIPSG